MNTILEEISREIEKLNHEKHKLFGLKRHRTRKYKRLRIMEKNLKEAYGNLKKYSGMNHFWH